MKNKEKYLINRLFLVSCLILTSCAKVAPPANYDASEVGKVKKVSSGVIISMRPAYIRNTVAANNSNAGNNVDDGVTRSRGFEYVVRLNSGAVISLVQTDMATLKVQQRVLVIYGDNTRIVSDDGKEDW